MFRTAFSIDKSSIKKKETKMTEYSAILQYIQIPCVLAFHEFSLNYLDSSIHERPEIVL